MVEKNYSKLFMRRLLLFMVLFVFCTLFLNRYGITQSSIRGKDLPVTEEETKFTIVIDAGHGGEDSGAVGINGVLEKDLNLSIALQMKALFEEKGFRVVLTRSDDSLLYTEEQNIYGQRKLYDLRNRLQIASSEKNAILVSIHMNRFSQSKYSGLQVYYSPNHAKSRLIASQIQSNVIQILQPHNHRQIKEANSSIYLMHRATMPAVLIECGFLSNPDECTLLSNEKYQQQLSIVLVDSIATQINQMNVKDEVD